MSFTAAMTSVLDGTTPGHLGVLIYLDFDPAKGSGGGPVRLSTFPFEPVTWTPPAGYTGTTWISLARIVNLGEIRWSSDMINSPMLMVLGAADAARLNDVMNASRTRTLTMWLAAYADGAIVADPEMILWRRMYPASANATDLTATVALESLFNRTRGRAVKRRSDADQRKINPSDESLLDSSQGTLGNDAQNWVQKSGF